MSRSLLRLLSVFAILSIVSTSAFAQGAANSSLSGLVVDSGGGVIPGATVLVKNEANGTTAQAVTNTAGVFSLPGLQAGTYTVTVSLSGFKTVSIKDVKLLTASPSNIAKITLEVGALSETVNVTAGSELVQTASTVVSNTITSDEIKNLPLVTRNALNFVPFLPGVDTSTIQRSSTINGLPQSALNITIDGVNIQDNFNKTGDGFFALIRPQLDAVEEVTVTGATPGANTAGQGGVQIAFTTKSGTNKLQGNGYYYLRQPSFNTNYYFNKVANLPKNEVTVKQMGFSVGGPIVIPGIVDGHNKAFFFFNHEEFRQPTAATRTRTVASASARAGIFNYTGGPAGGINLLALAAANGQIATFDPIALSLLNSINDATQKTGTLLAVSDLNNLSYIFQAPSTRTEHIPTTSINVNISPRHRLSGAYYFQRVISQPDLLNNAEAPFPGFPGAGNQDSYRNQGSLHLRSTFSASVVNEVNFGYQSSPVHFFTNLNVSDFDNQGGFAIQYSSAYTNPFNAVGPSFRNAPNWNIDDTMNYLHGKHSLQFGGSFNRFQVASGNYTVVPTITTGMASADPDPANAMFSTANFPGASATNLADARNLYGLITGRVQSIAGTMRLDEDTNQYVYNGQRILRGQLDDIGMFVQDQWRVTPTVTINGGLRWEVQMPFTASNSIMSTTTFADLCGISGTGTGFADRNCNLFNPNANTGIHPTYVQYNAGNKGYNTDWNNAAPNVGVAWRPNVKSGILRSILGDPEQATIRGGYSVAYTRYGMGDFTGVFGGNPGSQLSATRSVGNGNIGTMPLLLSQPALLGPPTVVAGAVLPTTGQWPILGNTANSLNIFDPDLKTSFSWLYTIGLQRAISRNMAVEAMYVGTRNVGQWVGENWNEVNFQENGFLSEFKLGQANLQANLQAGRGASFAYFGPGTGTSPMPIYVAYLQGLPASRATDPTVYAAANFTNSGLVARFNAFNPSLGGAAGDLSGNAARRTNAAAAGLPLNFFVLNPEVSAANITRNAGFSKYDALQMSLRRRFSNGLLFNANYTYAKRNTSTIDTLRTERFLVKDTGNEVPHALKMDWVFDVPFGRGRHFGTDMNRIVDAVIGGWSVTGTARVQTGRQVSLTGVQLVGMTAKDLQKMYRARKDPAGSGYFYFLPDDVIDNTIKAFSTSATLTGYGSLGPPTGRYIAPESSINCLAITPGQCSGTRSVYMAGPIFKRMDLTVKKQFAVVGHSTFLIQYDMLNVFNAINIIPVSTTSTTRDNYLAKSGYTDSSNTFDPGGRLGQLQVRFTW